MKSSRQDEDDGTERILCKFAWEKQVDWAEKKGDKESEKANLLKCQPRRFSILSSSQPSLLVYLPGIKYHLTRLHLQVHCNRQ